MTALPLGGWQGGCEPPGEWTEAVDLPGGVDQLNISLGGS